ncbi:FAD binding domain-containing protein [Colletotrichum orchidophilum]|uniref:FAD binding domain-containing protein n=1 Tax=Colletotrichum orchidophilum TaxID=1209926 RepID=A0A1G4BNS6_9PEZI|nr:FAD binding domain-containing protein [Colletotrichum orchidophilum]OHF02946.1 FAD binding domain-containing protein [Colletotrichum orchidophilum]
MRTSFVGLASMAAMQLWVTAGIRMPRSDDALPGGVSYPNSTQYAISNNYWSAPQAETRPACFVTPKSTEEVFIIIKTLDSLSAQFTVKSGGHTAFAGGSNIEDGVTIDLARLNHITVSDDRRTVSIGSGNRWYNVSQVLDPLGLAVVGGRVSDVGVSGLILGGGISYFSGEYGWACDNVRNFEVVLASGEIVNASASENMDLFWALRGGGGSNFGVVTRFDLVAFEQGDIWLYNPIYPLPASSELVPAFVDLVLNGLPSDHDAHTFFVMANFPGYGDIIASYMYHAKPPLAAGDAPPVFANMMSVPGAISNTTMVANVTTHTINLSEPYGLRKSWSGTSVYLKEGSVQFLQDIIPLWQAHAQELMAAAEKLNEALSPLFVYQPISTNILEAMQKNGGNALGLTPEAGPLIHIQVTTHWGTSELDGLVESRVADLIEQIDELAEDRGVAAKYIYMNYAGQHQDVYGGVLDQDLDHGICFQAGFNRKPEREDALEGPPTCECCKDLPDEEEENIEDDEWYLGDEASSPGPLHAVDLPNDREHGFTIRSLHGLAALTHLSIGIRALMGSKERRDWEVPPPGTPKLHEQLLLRLIDAFAPSLQHLCICA